MISLVCNAAYASVVSGFKVVTIGLIGASPIRLLVQLLLVRPARSSTRVANRIRNARRVSGVAVSQVFSREAPMPSQEIGSAYRLGVGPCIARSLSGYELQG